MRFALATLLAGILGFCPCLSPAAESLELELATLTKESPEFARFGRDVLLFEIVLEETRRAMLVGQCSGLDRRVPSFQQAAVVDVAEAVLAEREAMQRDPSTQGFAMRQLVDRLLFLAWPQDELPATLRFLESEDGRKAMLALEHDTAIVLAADHMFDASSGKLWIWPFGRLVDFMRRNGLESRFVAALDRVQPQLSDRVLAISSDPRAPFDERFAEELEKVEWEQVSLQFHLTAPPDVLAAGKKLSRLGLAEKRNQARQAMGLLISPGSGPGLGQAKPDAAKACAAAKGSPCDRQTVEDVAAMNDRWIQLYDFDRVRSIVLRDPRSGCRIRKTP